MGVATSSRSARSVVAATSNPWSDSSQRSQRCTKAATPTLVPGWLLNTGRLSPGSVLCKPKGEAPLPALTMRNAALLMASLLLGSMALAGGKRATAQGPSEQFATAEAMRVIPKGATITNTTCKSIDVGASSRYQCSITYSP